MLAEFSEHDAVSMALTTTFTWLAVWALTDALNRSRLAFRAAGHNKALWIALPIMGIAIAVLGNPLGFLIGGVFGFVYLVEVRHNIRRVCESAAAETFGALVASDREPRTMNREHER